MIPYALPIRGARDDSAQFVQDPRDQIHGLMKPTVLGQCVQLGVMVFNVDIGHSSVFEPCISRGRSKLGECRRVCFQLRMPSPTAEPMEPTHAHLATRLILLPKDTNAHGTILEGLLSQIDLAAAVEVRRYTRKKIVAVAMKELKFHEPVYVGDVVSFTQDCNAWERPASP